MSKIEKLKDWQLYAISGGSVLINTKTNNIMPVPEHVIQKLLQAAEHGAPFKGIPQPGCISDDISTTEPGPGPLK